MRTEVTPDQITRYRERGYVVIDGFLSEEELGLWRRRIDAAVAAREDRKLANSDWRAGDSYYDKVFTQRINLWMDHDGVRPPDARRADRQDGRRAGRRRRPPHLARPGPRQGTLGQPHGLAPRQPLLVVLVAPRHQPLGRPRRRHPRQRLPLLPPRHPQDGHLGQRPHRPEHGRPLRAVPRLGFPRGRRRPHEGRLLLLPQRACWPTAPAPT